MQVRHKYYEFQVVVNINVAKFFEDDPPTTEEVELMVERQLDGWDDEVKGNVKVGKVVVKD